MTSTHDENYLRGRNISELRKICTSLGVPSCIAKGYIKKSELISLILGVESHGAEPDETIILEEENLDKLTVVALKKIMKEENISLPAGKPSLKKNLILAIRDHRARLSGVVEVDISVKKSAVKKPVAKKSAVKKPVAKKPAVKKPVAKKSAAKKDLYGMGVGELRKICKELGIESCVKPGYLKKDKLIDLIRNYQAEDKILSPIKPFDVEPPVITEDEFKYLCGKTKNVCGDKICDADTGKCLARTKKDRNIMKRAREERQKKYGNDYYFDTEYGLVGRRGDVMKYIDQWKKVSAPLSVKKPSAKKPVKKPSPKKPSPKKPSPKKPVKKPSPKKPVKKPVAKPAKRTCVDKDNYLECNDDQICSAISKRCIKDNSNFRKGKYLLTVDGRKIVGAEKTIKELQAILGGSISSADGKKPAPPKPSPKTVTGIDKRLKDLLEGVDDDEIEKLEKKKKELLDKKKTAAKKPSAKKPSAKKPSAKKPISGKLESPKISAAKQDIAITFSKCLASLPG